MKEESNQTGFLDELKCGCILLVFQYTLVSLMLEVWKILNEMGNEFCPALFTSVESVDVFTHACTHSLNDMLPFSSLPHMYSI